MQIKYAQTREARRPTARARLYATFLASIASNLCAAATDAAAPAAATTQRSEQTTQLPTVTTRTSAQADPTRGYEPRTSAVASATAQSLLDIPQAVAVVSGTVMEDQQARSLDDVLGNVSGITQTNTLGGTRDAFIKRGFGENDDGSILVDGMRSPVLHNYLATIDRVEVLKGPASLLYGIQEPGGVINLVTRKPEDEFHGSVSATRTSHGGSGASFDLTGPIGQAGQVAGGTLAFRLIGEYDTSRYWRSFGRQRDSLIAPALSWHDAKTSIDVSYQYVDYTMPFDRGTVLVNGHLDDSLRYRRYEEPWSQSTGIQETFRARVEHRLSDQWKLRASYGWARDRYQQYLTRARSFNSTTGALSRSSDANLGRNESDEIATIGAIGELDIAGMRHDVYFGAEYERQRVFRGDTIRGNAVSGFDLYDPVYGTLAAGGKASASQSDSLTKVHTYSLITQDAVHLTDRLIASAGIRWETYQQYSGVGRPFVVADDSHGNVWLPQFGLVYKIAPSLAFYANYSRSFKPNVADDVDAPLAPERGQIYEAGLKFDLKPGIAGTLAVYQIDKHNVAVTVGDVTSTIGSARSRGVELDVAGRLSNHWSLIGSYAYTDAVDRSDNTPMVNAARHSGSLFAVYNTALPHISGQWRFGGGMRLVGKRPGDTANSFTLPGYVVADLFAAYETKVGKLPTRVQLNVKNLFDKTYYPSSSSNLIIAVGEARLVTLTTTVSF
ncbi:TonB-dependent siderophore receptor [Trinickia caryophylli]|uniref:Iron complex outermembrane recepter protein n=1 Tax=Trinickia caryophylli TaxID=28094 RepID=A0A1X7ED48_TRICW|nr:TonB-dependent siderophore receptor [Trinickia caryophylli]PMS12909.1 TonB-dependent siderophore receptor [Trinickia caryophylli]TRX14666.1 TonB-dependent siderophore receptor [Trinickia caryophylli]WQE14510.1 TonB-dependent siderophore receptor [Trinickia caryophylli]SMF31531.1 iron complex outermembrane recepter protein [Trinickia caryophylli]GLU32084.1 TonB-dependent receptor [Trinickia caryophylli]